MIARLLTLTAILGLSACAGTPPPIAGSQPAEKQQGLSARQLANGECGLFVWTADSKRQFVLFSQSQKSRAALQTSEGEISLIVASQSGQAAQRQYPQQSFNAEDGRALALDLRRATSIDNGTRYQAGTLTQSEAEGWDRVTPVVGLSACKTAAINTAS